MEIKNHNIFPIQVHTFQTNIDTTPIKHLVESWTSILDVNGLHYGEGTGGLQGGGEIIENVAFDEFHKTLNTTIPKLYRKGYNIISKWISIYNKGDYNKIHNHPTPQYLNSELVSGIFYIQTQPNDSKLVIHSHQNVGDTEEFDPNEGDIILFRSSTYHSVTPKKFDSKRICLAFNLKLN